MPEGVPQPAAALAGQAGAPKAPAGSLHGIHTVMQSIFISAISPVLNLLPSLRNCCPLSSRLCAAGAREQILELVRSLAAMVGSSGLILEVLGGVCTRFVHVADAPRGNAIACFQAALQGASKVWRTGITMALAKEIQKHQISSRLAGSHAPAMVRSHDLTFWESFPSRSEVRV